MTTGHIPMKDGVEIFFKDWGKGQPVVFSHGWPLTADIWDPQLMFVANNGYRAIAHDRRGGGRSSQSWDGNDLDTYADDLGQVLDAMDLHDVVLVGHSTGGGEITRYVGRHGTSRVAKMVLVSAIPPLILKPAKTPEGLPIDVLTGSATGSTPTGPSSTKTPPFRSSAPTAPATRSPKACWTSSGCSR